MAELFNITLENGDLSDFDTTVEDGGNLSVTRAAALLGTTYGMQAFVDDTTAIYAEKTWTLTTEILRFRFYFDPNGITMVEGDNFNISTVMRLGTARFQIRLMWTSGAYYIDTRLRADNSSWADSADTLLTDEVHLIEYEVTRATGPTAFDGRIKLWLDGIEISTLTGDNYDTWSTTADLDEFRVGAAGGIDVGTSGTIYFDEIKGNDDGTLIGPVTTAGARGRYDTADYGAEARSRYGASGGRY